MLRQCAIRRVLEAKKEPGSASGACPRIGEQLGINPEALRGWVQRAEIDADTRPGTMTADAERLAELVRENRELHANVILRSASAFFAAEPGRPLIR